ncbi:CoF synthetase [Actinosynnema sp. ALI-1.44]|uniref:phenylacetate--CoA ligase family protein n=1 Tax=Actinosynnema sp. ALI-1.44 TaxID=1933779 RepID=UPI00097BD5E7|nr:AMP-binding protein [Actinosynnema sp. ALI-1.44]ONI88617.1 CoF synthetase [Actinosynnema sp. ALI-1.44]
MRTTPAEFPAIGQWDSIAELYEFQDKCLPEALEMALRAPFHRGRLAARRLPRSASELGALPLTTKQDLRENYPWGMLATGKDELATYHESSGTSGEPTPSYFTEADWHDVVTRFVRGAIDLSPSDTVMVRTPYAMLTTAHQAHQAARWCGATVIPADNRSLVMPYSRVIKVLHDLAVSVAWCLPSECLLWAAAARAAGLRPERDFPALRGFLVAGEPLTGERRERIARLWGGVPVWQDYGSTETGSLAGECPAGRLHLWADRFVAEVRDPETGACSREGVGTLVITTLFRRAMPLVRYDIEDWVRITSGECPCHWQLPTIEVLGRHAAGVPVGGVRVTQHQVEQVVFGLPERFGVLFWRARARRDLLEVEIEVDTDLRAAACAELIAAIRSRIGVDCAVRGVPPGTLVPRETLTGGREFVKPRNLFAEDEDWHKAVIYY